MGVGGTEHEARTCDSGPQPVPAEASTIPALLTPWELYFSIQSFALLELNLNYYDYLYDLKEFSS